MPRAHVLLPVLCWLAACATAPAPPPPTLAPARAAPEPAEAFEEIDLHPTADGRDLIETPEQTYARVHGSCDFRDPNVPSPLEREEALTVLFDPRNPSALRWMQSGMLRDAPPGVAALSTRLNARGVELQACSTGLTPSATPIDKGLVVDLRLVPQAGPGLRVERAQPLDLDVVRCVEQRAAALLGDVRIDQMLHLAVVVPDAAFPEGKPTLDKDVIRRIIYRNIGSVRACYQAALDVWPEIHGSVTVRFAIDSNDGRVLDARVVGDDIGKPALACCIARNVYGWHFAGNGVKGVSIVTYPFILDKVQ